MERTPSHTLTVVFYCHDLGTEPVRKWLKLLDRADRKAIGEDIKTVELGWPLGMPLVEKLDKDLWEVRSTVSHNRIARVLFTISGSHLVLLHGFIKKARKTPVNELALAKKRRDQYLGGET